MLAKFLRRNPTSHISRAEGRRNLKFDLVSHKLGQNFWRENRTKKFRTLILLKCTLGFEVLKE